MADEPQNTVNIFAEAPTVSADLPADVRTGGYQDNQVITAGEYNGLWSLVQRWLKWLYTNLTRVETERTTATESLDTRLTNSLTEENTTRAREDSAIRESLTQEVNTRTAEVSAANRTRQEDDTHIRETLIGVSGSNTADQREALYNATGLAGLSTGHPVVGNNITVANAISAVRAALDSIHPVGSFMWVDPKSPFLSDDSNFAKWRFLNRDTTNNPDAVWLEHDNHFNVSSQTEWRQCILPWVTGRQYGGANKTGWYVLEGGLWARCYGYFPLPLSFLGNNAQASTKPTLYSIYDLTGQTYLAGVLGDDSHDREKKGDSSLTLLTANLPSHNHELGSSAVVENSETLETSRDGMHNHDLRIPTSYINSGGTTADRVIGDKDRNFYRNFTHTTTNSGSHVHTIAPHNHGLSGTTNTQGSGQAINLDETIQHHNGVCLMRVQ